MLAGSVTSLFHTGPSVMFRSQLGRNASNPDLETWKPVKFAYFTLQGHLKLVIVCIATL